MLFNAVSLLLASASASAAVIAVRQDPITSYSTSPIAWAYPPGRGFSAATSESAPCGGFPLGARTQYPLTGGDVAFTQIANLTNVNILYTNETNPTRFHTFQFYSNSITALGAGHFCTKSPDFAARGFSAGDNATMLVIFQLNKDSPYYYQCADVSLVETSAYTAPTDQYVCGNYTSTLQEAKGQDFGGSEQHAHNATSASNGTSTQASVPSAVATSASANEASASSDNGLSVAAGGGIGAAVTIVVIALLLAAAFFTGLISFGKKQAVRGVSGDDASSSSGHPTMKQATV